MRVWEDIQAAVIVKRLSPSQMFYYAEAFMYRWLLWLLLLTYGKLASCDSTLRQLRMTNCVEWPRNKRRIHLRHLSGLWALIPVECRVTADWTYGYFWSHLLADTAALPLCTRMHELSVLWSQVLHKYSSIVLSVSSAFKQVFGCRKKPRASFARQVPLWTCCYVRSPNSIQEVCLWC